MFGRGVSTGWVELETNSASITGSFFLSDSRLSSIDGAALGTAPASRLIFPKVTTDVSADNRLIILNTSALEIRRVGISIFENSGRLVTQRSFELGPFAGFSGG